MYPLLYEPLAWRRGPCHRPRWASIRESFKRLWASSPSHSHNHP